MGKERPWFYVQNPRKIAKNAAVEHCCDVAILRSCAAKASLTVYIK
jgi:hypothetical protein